MGYFILNLRDMKLTDVPLEVSAVLKAKSDSRSDFARGHITLYYTYTTPAYVQQQVELAKKAAAEEDALLAEAPHYESSFRVFATLS